MQTYQLNFVIGNSAELLIECDFDSDDLARDGSRHELGQRIGISLVPGSVKVARLDTRSDIDEWLGAWDCGGPESEYEWRDADRWPLRFQHGDSDTAQLAH